MQFNFGPIFKDSLYTTIVLKNQNLNNRLDPSYPPKNTDDIPTRVRRDLHGSKKEKSKKTPHFSTSTGAD